MQPSLNQPQGNSSGSTTPLVPPAAPPSNAIAQPAIPVQPAPVSAVPVGPVQSALAQVAQAPSSVQNPVVTPSAPVSTMQQPAMATPAYAQSAGTVPPRAARKSGRGWLIGIVIAIFLLGFGVLSIAFSDTSDTATETTAPTPKVAVKKPPVYMSAADIAKVKSAIDGAKSIAELETSVNKAVSEVPFEDESGGKLGFRAFKLALSDKSEYKSTFNKFQGNFTPLTETQLPEAKKALYIIIEEFARYPMQLDGGFMHSIVLGKNVSYDSSDANKAAGITNTVILFDVDELAKQDAYSRRIVNHESWHAHDFTAIVNDVVARGGDNVSETLKKVTTEYEASWASLNSQGIAAYSGAGFNHGDPTYFNEHPKPGFATGYAMRNTYEDSAVTFEYLMAKELRPKLLEWAKTDPDLQKKINRIKEEITAYTLIIDPDKDLFAR